MSYLALDIDSAKCLLSSVFEERPSFASQKSNVLRPVFQKFLAVVINDELGSISVRFEAELLRDEPQSQVWLITVESR